MLRTTTTSRSTKLYDHWLPAYNSGGTPPTGVRGDNTDGPKRLHHSPDKKIKWCWSIPMTTGRNFRKSRVIDSLQMTAKQPVARPPTGSRAEESHNRVRSPDDEGQEPYIRRAGEIGEANPDVPQPK